MGTAGRLRGALTVAARTSPKGRLRIAGRDSGNQRQRKDSNDAPRVGTPGHLYLSRGRWKRKQLLSASFVGEATMTQVPAALPGRSASLLSGAYGFYWWTNGRRRWPAAPPGIYAARGAGTNLCFVVPEWNMVLVRMGNSDLPGTPAEQDQLWRTFFAKLVDALGRSP